MNPVGGAPIFLGLTRFSSAAERASIARQVGINGFLLLLGALLVGSHVLEFFGITLPVVRIAGGLVVSAFAWQLLHSGYEPDQPPAPDSIHRKISSRDTFYPLTMPLTVGPGSIAVAITLGSQRPAEAVDAAHIALVAAAAVLGLAPIAASIYVCYRYAERIAGFLGEAGTNVLVRLSAFILLCIGISIVWSGAAPLIAAARG